MICFNFETKIPVDSIDTGKVIEEIKNNGWTIDLDNTELIIIRKKNSFDSEVIFTGFRERFVIELQERVEHYNANDEVLCIINANCYNPYGIDVVKLVKSEEEKYVMLKQLSEKLISVKRNKE